MPWSRRFLVSLAMVGLIVMPVGQAGTREDPEVVDSPNDVTRYPGVPTVDPTVDILAVWFVEASEELTVSMEVAQVGSDVPDANSVNQAESYAVNVFVDGEDAGDERCSGWGDFGVRWGSGQPSGELSYGWHHDGSACPAESEPVTVAVEANVITWTLPKTSLAMLRSGSELTVARADAWSGDTWPLTPDDRADELPGRPFLVQSAPTPGSDTGPADEGPQSAGPTTTGTPEGNGTAAPPAQPTDVPGFPLPLAVIAVALAIGVRRRLA